LLITASRYGGGMNPREIDLNSSGRLAFTRTEAARMLGITPVSIDRLTKRGLLRPSRATRRPLYPVWELERFLRDTAPLLEANAGNGRQRWPS
jgi:hypothetical protein